MSLERLTACPLCKSGLFLNHSEVRDLSISKELFFICRCTQCGLLFTNPRPDQEEISRYYQSEDYISHQNKSNNPINLIFKLVRYFTIRKKVKQLNYYSTKKGSLLDYGCGTGHFLKAAKAKGWKTTGIEPNEPARKMAKKSGIKVNDSLDSLKKSKPFDAITLFHVIEHVHELRSTIKKLNRLLDAEGRLFLAVPNHHSFDARHYTAHWAAWDVPRHLYHFSPETMNYLAMEFEMEIIETLPMVFDSYYVSILSEKYSKPEKNSILNFINGIILGQRSNKWAKENQNNYSSLLFILKKK